LQLADTWKYEFGTSAWSLVSPEPANSAEVNEVHPGRRHALGMAAPTDAGFYIFGGTRHIKGQRPMALNDLWYFAVEPRKWSRLAPSTGLPTPSPRSHMSLVALSSKHLLM
jgi:hypothetical protein